MGPATESSETLIGTSGGVVKASAIKRFPESQQWDLQAILDMQGTPQWPNPNKPGWHIPIRIWLEPDVKVDMPEMRPARDEEAPKRPYLKTFHFEEHGYTEDWEGCARLAPGMPARPHLEVCRTKLYEEFGKAETGQKLMERPEKRTGEYLEGKAREGDEKERAQSQEGIATDTSVRPNGPGVSSDIVVWEHPGDGDRTVDGNQPDDGEDGMTLEEFGKKRKTKEQRKKEVIRK